jgi:C-terminal processing protease CtpA/Prc
MACMKSGNGVRPDVRATTGREARAHLVDVVVERSSQGTLGIMFSLQPGSNKCVVTSLKPDSTASGTLAPGDKIYYVDNKPVAGLTTAELMGIMKGDAFSRVSFKISPGNTHEMLSL